MKEIVLRQIEKLRFIHKSPKASVVFLQIVAGVLLSLAALIVFADITEEVLQSETMLIDTSLSQMIYSLREPSLTQTMIIISFFGADFILFSAGVITILLAWRKHKREAILFLAVLTIGVLLNMLLKAIFQRPRPSIDPILTLSEYSFPSGHAMNSFIFYSTLSYFVYHFTRNKKLVVIISLFALCMILLIGFSRVYLGVHYPSDVLAGYIAGFFVFMSAIVLFRSIAFRELVQVVKDKEKKLRK